jgi:aminomethyltransferase
VVFDVSHLGTVRVAGDDAFEELQRALSNDLRKVGPGRAQYTHLLDEQGSVVDDIIVWWLADDVFDVMPNASNTARVLAAIGGTDTTADRAVLAVQGPDARRRLAQVAPEAATVGRFAVASFEWQGAPCIAAGTGYTGEDGVECAVPAGSAEALWAAIVGAGIAPAGLGARDTLRLEAGLPLHGHELGPGITPLQAGLGWVVGWDKGPFVGRAALEAERESGPARRLRGLLAAGRQPPREGAVVMTGPESTGPEPPGSEPPGSEPPGSEPPGSEPPGSEPAGPGQAGAVTVGTVTSGNFSPMLERGIAMAFLTTASGIGEGDRVTVEQRGRSIGATVVKMPFWRRKEA